MDIDKDKPSAEWIASLHDRFPCEREIRRVRDCKLERRAEPPFQAPGLEALCAGLERLLTDRLDTSFAIRAPRWLTGGASKVQMAFDLEWQPQGGERTTQPMVLRMEPAASIAETSRLREFELLRTMQGVVPVPEVFWVDNEAEHLPCPGLVCGFVEGVTRPSDSPGGISGLGTNYGPGLREVLGAQFVEHLAKIHLHDWPDGALDSFHLPFTDTQSVILEIRHWQRVWAEDSGEDVPLLHVAANWLLANAPSIDQLSIVHGDYRVGNFLFDEDSQQITAWLDWELGHLGDRHDDLAFATSRVLGHLHEDGETFLACGLLPVEQLIADYERASGLTVDPEKLAYYRVLNLYKLTVICVATAPRVMRGGKSHQDITLAWPVS
ncbi:MAG: phosphotransferase family protein, partial [Salinisphaera sp.]|nr:phosphotransferase family protein [Salinisphaera sp.]